MNYDISHLNTEHALSFIKHLNDDILIFEDVINFYYNCDWAYPLGMLLSIVGIKHCRYSNQNTKFTFYPDKSCKSYGYASHMGFFKSISDLIDIGNAPGQATGSESYVPITIINFDELWKKASDRGDFLDLNETIELESKRLSKVLCRNDMNMQNLFSYIIRELLRNIPEHSESKTAYICAQHWKDGYAEIAILDEGIGIKNSLRKNSSHKEYIISDLDALESAIQPGISQAFSPDSRQKSNDTWANSGFGLYMTSEICKKLKGLFWIISGNKALKITESEIKEYDTFLEGTAIGIRFKISNSFNSHKLIAETAQHGEEIAKNIRNAFKYASEPSKSLFMTTLENT